MIEWLSGWWNWPFLFFLALGVIFILADLLLGGLSHLGLDADMDVDADADVDVDADADVDASVGHSHGVFLSGLLWLGLGRVPLTILLEVLCITFGVLGLLVNALWSEVSPNFLIWVSFPLALIFAFVGALFLTKWSALTIASFLPGEGTISRRAGGFVGEPGVVISTVTNSSGQVRIQGTGRIPDTVISVKCDATAPSTIPPGRQVVVMGYLEATNTYTVAPMEEIG